MVQFGGRSRLLRPERDSSPLPSPPSQRGEELEFGPFLQELYRFRIPLAPRDDGNPDFVALRVRSTNQRLLCHHPERMRSLSPGLRGTSYPGFALGWGVNPERVASSGSRGCQPYGMAATTHRSRW